MDLIQLRADAERAAAERLAAERADAARAEAERVAAERAAVERAAAERAAAKHAIEERAAAERPTTGRHATASPSVTHTKGRLPPRPTRAPTILLAALVFFASVGLGLAAERLRRGATGTFAPSPWSLVR